MKWAEIWQKVFDNIKDWNGRVATDHENLVATKNGRKLFYFGLCGISVLVIGTLIGYPFYKEREYYLRAETAYRGGFYKEAFKNYKILAEKGNVDAMIAVANMYLEGQGTKKNQEKAIDFLKQAATENNSEAQTKLGMLYFDSSYINRTCLGHDYKLALEWFLKSGKNPQALEAIGTMYSLGLGVPVNPRLAESYFDQWINTYLEKANNGDANAQYQMGLYFIDGQRHSIDEEKAIAWFEKSAAQNYVKALESLGFLYLIGGEKTEPNTEKAKVYFQKLKDIYEKRAANNDVDAMIYLAQMYHNGDGIDADQNKAAEYYIQAAESDSIVAKETLADLIEKKDIEVPSYITAERLRAEAMNLRRDKALEGDITMMKDLGFKALNAISSTDGVYNDEEAKTSLNDKTKVVSATSDSTKKTSSDSTEKVNHELADKMADAALAQIDKLASVPVSDNEIVTVTENTTTDNTIITTENIIASTEDLSNQNIQKQEIKSAENENKEELTQTSSNDVDTNDKLYKSQYAEELKAQYDEAIRWFSLAAEAGDAMAMLELGRIYKESPLAEIQNESQAINWFKESSKQCYEPAYLELGAEYAKPKSQYEDTKEALNLYEAAAMQGSIEAQFLLAKLLARGGKGVQPNYVSALTWLLVVKQGIETRGNTDDSFYENIVSLEEKYARFLTDEELNQVHLNVQDMVAKYGTNW